MADKKEYIERGALGIGKANRDLFADPKYADGWNSAIEIIETAPAADVVSRGVLEQVKWERDMAMQQLEEHGIPFGAKADVVEVRHGEWIESTHWGEWYYDCPFCDDGFATRGRCETPPNFCSNCGAKLTGAKMVGERKDIP